MTKPLDNYRKIAQIAGSENRIYALATDGTLWEMNSGGHWLEHPPLPATETEWPRLCGTVLGGEEPTKLLPTPEPGPVYTGERGGFYRNQPPTTERPK